MSHTMRLTIALASIALLTLLACMANPHFVGGKNYVKQEVWEKAAVEFEIAVKEQPNNEEAWYYLGWSYGEMGEYGKAADAFSRSKEISDKFAAEVDEKVGGFWSDLAARGQDLKDGGNYDAAAEKFEQAIKLRPEEIDTYNYVADLYVRMGKVDEAASNFEKALEIDPGNEAALTNYANFLEQSGLTDRAIPLFERLSAEQPEDENLRHYLADLYMTVGRKDDAVAIYSDLGDPSFFMNAAYDAFAAEDFQTALDNYQSAAAVADPASQEYKDASYNAVVAAYKMKDFAASVELGEKLVKEIPDDARSWKILGNGYARLKQAEKALEAHKKAEDLERGR